MHDSYILEIIQRWNLYDQGGLVSIDYSFHYGIVRLSVYPMFFCLCGPSTWRFISMKNVANCTNKSPWGRGHAVTELRKYAPCCLATYFNSVWYVAGEMLVFTLN